MVHVHRGFTVIELLVVAITIGTLAIVGVISYGDWKRRTVSTAVQNDVVGASASLATNMNFKNSYPPNLSGINFTPSPDVALVLYTNAPTNGVYQTLTPDQNAQLLLNVCNANLNGLYNTVCTFVGNGGGAKIHVKGTNATNTQWQSPIAEDKVTLPYGPEYEAATASIIAQFTSQGGTFPVSTPGAPVTMPEPTLVPIGKATNFCLEGRSGLFTDIVYHITPNATDSKKGACPDDPSLHYLP